MARAHPIAPSLETSPEEMYLDLLKRTLSGRIYGDRAMPIGSARAGPKSRLDLVLSRIAGRRGLSLVRQGAIRRDERITGAYFPAQAHTMVGPRRLDNLQECVTAVIRDDVPGDLFETGVWRGGTAILMRAVLAAYRDPERCVWAADSFKGLPPPDTDRYPADAGDRTHEQAELAVSEEEVRRNFAKYGLLDDRVRFLAGWFEDTLPDAPVQRLALLRLDGDMYSSTIVALEALYHKVSPGGFVLVDDYRAVPACQAAVDDFRARLEISEPLHKVDWTGVWWRVET